MLTARSSFWVREVPCTVTEPMAARTDRRPARCVGRAAVDARASDTVEVGSVRACMMYEKRDVAT